MTAPEVPQRNTLATQTVALVERGLQEGRWAGTLPGQHELCDQLGISRTTLRAALRQLARRGLVELHQGRPTRIRRATASQDTARRLLQVVLLLPEPLWRLRPSVAQWVGELRPRLQRSGLELVINEGGRHYRARPNAALARLVAAHPRSAWVLFASTFAMQEWFASRDLPVLLVGPTFPGLDLPSIEYDHANIAQHAAQHLAAAGHRRTAVLLQRTGSAADATTCDAFASVRPPGAVAPLVLEHDGSLAQINAQLRRLAGLRERPTALFITKTLAVPTAYTLLPRLGLEIPRDLSVICREDDPFLEYLVPAVTRYSSDSAALARQLAQSLARLAEGQPLALSHERLMPRFVAGRSVAPLGPSG